MVRIAGKLIVLCATFLMISMVYAALAPGEDQAAEATAEVTGVEAMEGDMNIQEADIFDVIEGPRDILYGEDREITNTFTDSDGDGISDAKEIEMDLDPENWDTDGDLLGDGEEIGVGRGSTSPYLKDSDNDGLEDPWEDNDLDGIINYEEVVITTTDPNDNDTDSDEIPDDLELQIVAPGPINGNSHKYYKYTQVFVNSDNDGADGKNASGPDGRPGIAWYDDDGDGESLSPTNYYDVNGDGKFTLYKLDNYGCYIYEKDQDTGTYEKVAVDIPTTDVTDTDLTDSIPLVTGDTKLADGKDNDFSGTVDEGIDEQDEIAYSLDGAPGNIGVDDDGDSKDSDGDGYCDGQEIFQNSNPYDEYDTPMHLDASGTWVSDPVEPFDNWVDEADEYGWPGTDDNTDDSADDDGVVDNPNFVYDRFNPTLDISVINSPIDTATAGAFRWLVPYLWRSNEFYEAGKGGLPLNSTCIALTHWNPALLDLFDVDLYGDPLYDRGGPYRWNNYDTDPTEADTDTEGMEEDWDPRPTLPDERLDTLLAVNYFKNTEDGSVLTPKFGSGSQQIVGWVSGAALAPTAHDGYGFPHVIDKVPFEKGQKYEMSIFVGLEYTPPDSLPIKRGYFRPLNITIGWHNMSFGVDQVHYTSDDDFDGDGIPFAKDLTATGSWDYDPENADMPLVTLVKNDLKASAVPDDLGLDDLDLASEGYSGGGNYLGHSGLELPFANHTWDDSAYWSKMTFYEVKFFFYVPEGCPAGIIFVDILGDADTNIFYEDTPGTGDVSDYPMMYN